MGKLLRKLKNKIIKPNLPLDHMWAGEGSKSHFLDANCRPGALKHTLRPLHLFHNVQIDRWVVLMNCVECKKVHVFYPMD